MPLGLCRIGVYRRLSATQLRAVVALFEMRMTILLKQGLFSALVRVK
jgi:hypothetical protein